MAREPAHSFLIDELRARLGSAGSPGSARSGREVLVRPMFGSHAVYIGDKIVFITRHSASSVVDNGIWVVLSGDGFSLLRDFPSLRLIAMFAARRKKGVSHWHVLPEDSSVFEEDAFRLIDLAVAGDDRLGSVPKSRLRSSRKPSPARSKKSRATARKSPSGTKKLPVKKLAAKKSTPKTKTRR